MERNTETVTSDGVLPAPGTSSKLGSCEVCARNEAKYTCPRCEVKTCCLQCTKIHKLELECSGVRDRTKFIPINKFTNMDLSSDYRLLEEITRSVELLKKNRDKRATRVHQELPNHLFRLAKATNASKTTLKFLPRNFARHKQNTTRLNFASNIIYWHVDWIFPNAENLKLTDDALPETEKLSNLVNKYLTVQEDQILQERLQFYQAADIPGIRLFLKAEQKSGKKFYELDPLESLKDNLRNKVIIEFPVIHVVLKEHSHLYDVLDSDEEMEVDGSVCHGKDLANRIIKSAEREDSLYSSLKNLLFISERSDEDVSDDDMANAVHQIIAAASNALHEDDDFQQVVSHTRRSFRRRSQPQQASKRGRRSCGFFKRKTLLLRRANADYGPIKAECEMLTSCGLGYSDIEPKYLLDWNMDEMEDYIFSLYPKVPLQLVGFRLGRMDRQKKIFCIDVDNVISLKEVIGQSQIVIIPNRDLPLNLPPDSNNLEQAKEPVTILTSELSPSPRLTSQIPNRAVTAVTQDIVEPVYHEYEYLNHFEVSNDNDLLLAIPTLDENAEVVIVNVTRANCIHEMLNYYKDESITQKNLSVFFKDEDGIDGGGLTKELFNLFFKGIESFYFQGEHCLVPFLPLNRIRKDKFNFTIIGRILEHMLLLTGSIPSKLSKITLLLIANPNAEIDKNILIEEFYNFVNPCEKLMLKKSINNFDLLSSKEKNILSNIFNTFHFYEMPSKEEIFDQVASIALNTLVEAPKQFIHTMRQGINIVKYGSFWNKCDFATLLDMQKPTASKVANCLKTENDTLTNEQTNALHFLEMYIRCLHDDKIGQFVFLVTGSYQMPDFICVEFSNVVGLAQRPTFSTCTNTIHVPSTYCNYQELRRDFDLCLCSEEAYVYTNN
ncbi:hypothetical protein RN001_006756 [Aquatica leii]|uniref:Box C/D snoRNA protein 1 n=1 Tax=Aquatica leii TaxID=1421715 RepID=A0AAN7PDY1_9COLE|nr:hypothetical protein RN001_006756 [Aquatica leii]